MQHIDAAFKKNKPRKNQIKICSSQTIKVPRPVSFCTQPAVARTGSFPRPGFVWTAGALLAIGFLVGQLAQAPVSALADAGSVAYVNGYPTINGNYVDCSGNVDNDPAHHTTDPGDQDSAHHVGLNCPAGSLLAAASPAPAASAPAQAQSSSPAPEVLPAPAPAAAPQPATTGNGKIDIWWPVDGATILGVQPFKALVENTQLSSYQMYWQVDGGGLNLLSDNQTDSPHKETQVDVSGWNWHGSGPYSVNFVAKDSSGQVVASRSVHIYIPAAQQVSANVSPAPSVAQPALVIQQTSASITNPLAGQNFYIDHNSNSQQWINAYGSGQAANASLMAKIASQPNAVWLGSWNSNVQNDTASVIATAKSQNQMPILVLYNIPGRDCGGFSSGGAQTPDDYKSWVRQVAAGIGNSKVAVLLEPDGVALTSCLTQDQTQTRYSLLADAVSTLKANPNTAVYIDAGHPNWIDAGDMASRLKQSGIGQADGFALNVSNFTTTADNISYGQQISSQVNGKHFIIDTSRNGQGPAPDGAWCNPPGRGLGSKPTTDTGNPLVDAFIWAKDPGGSDGNCNGGPNAGVFWPDYAMGLAQRSIW